MVFVNEAWNGTGEIVVYSNYHKYWLDRRIHCLMCLAGKYWI